MSAALASNKQPFYSKSCLPVFAQVRRLPADCPEHFLEPFLQRSIPSTHPGFCRAPPPWRSMLYTVGCPHPMSRYIKVPLFSTVEKLVRGEQLPLRDVSLLQRQAPLLHEFLRNYLAAGMLPREVRELLSAMLKVAKQAVIPQRRRNTIPPVLQRARQQQQQGQELASTTAGQCALIEQGRLSFSHAICRAHLSRHRLSSLQGRQVAAAIIGRIVIFCWRC